MTIENKNENKKAFSVFSDLTVSWWQPVDGDPRAPLYTMQVNRTKNLIGLIEKYRKPPSTQQLLEVGSGQGTYTRLFENLGYSPVAVDISMGMLERTRSSTNRSKLVQANTLTLPFPDENFDICLSVGLSAHIPDLNMFLNELSRVTKSGGVIIFDISNKLGMHNLWERINPKISDWANYPRQSYSSKQVLKALMGANLSCEEVIGVGTIRPISLFPNWERLIISGKTAVKISNILDPVIGRYLGGILIYNCRKK